MYRYDASYAVEVQRAHPGRFAIVKPVDPDDPAVADVVADWKKTPGTVGIRIMLTKELTRVLVGDGGVPLAHRGSRARCWSASPAMHERASARCSTIRRSSRNGWRAR